MAYITLHNLRRITRSITLNNGFEPGQIYKTKIHFFNKFEKKQLFAIKAFIESPEEVVSKYYQAIPKSKDKRKYVFERPGALNAYHNTKDCRLLHNSFENVLLPEGLKKIGVTIEEYRNWFAKNMKHHFEQKRFDTIVEAVWFKFRVRVSKSDFVSYENSDVVEINNYSVDDLESELDKRIKAAGIYYYEHKSILENYSRRTYLAYKGEEIKDNETGLSDGELKDFLKSYDKQYKEPVKTLLLEWYKLNLNPDLSIDGNLLERLNFKPCSCCCSKKKEKDNLSVETIRSTQIVADSLPNHVGNFSEYFRTAYKAQ